MTADFWTLLTVLLLTLAFGAGAGFLIHVFAGVVFLLLGLLIAASTLYTQHCLRAGGCAVWAWVQVALYALSFVGTIGVFIAAMRARRADRADRERRKVVE